MAAAISKTTKLSTLPSFVELFKQERLLRQWICECRKVEMVFSYHFISAECSDKMNGHYTHLDFMDQLETYRHITDLYFAHAHNEGFRFRVALSFIRGKERVMFQWEK